MNPRTILKDFFLTGACCILLAFAACIPIEDKIDPSIASFGTKDSLAYYLDTLGVYFVFTDNNSLDTGIIEIRKTQLSPTDQNPWQLDSLIDLRGGRRYADTLRLVVPAFVNTGNYTVVVRTRDAGSNEVAAQRTIDVASDITPPSFNQIILDLDTLADGTYTACRGDFISLSGEVSDNLVLRRLGFQFGEGNRNLGSVSGSSTDLEAFFGSQIRIPPTTTDLATLPFSLIAIDSFGNQTIETIDIFIDCDDLPPNAQVLASEPALTQNNQVSLTPDGLLTISALALTDNRFIRSASIFFHPANQPPQLFSEVAINQEFSADLANFTELNFRIPPDARIGTDYRLTIEVQDSVDFRTPLNITINVVEDLAPVFVITDTYINNVRTPYSTASAVTVRAGERLAMDGKVEDLNSISSFEITLSSNQREQPIATFQRSYQELRTLNLTEFFQEGQFQVPIDGEIGEQLSLTLTAIDNKDQVNSLRYLFEIVAD